MDISTDLKRTSVDINFSYSLFIIGAYVKGVVIKLIMPMYGTTVR